MKIIKTREISGWCEDAMLGFTQGQLKEFLKAGAEFEVFCVPNPENPNLYEVFIEIRTKDPESPVKRMVLITQRKERKFKQPQTICKLMLHKIGIKSICFWSIEKAQKEGLFPSDNVENNNNDKESK